MLLRSHRTTDAASAGRSWIALLYWQRDERTNACGHSYQ